jgi:hypothetical protein
LACSSAASRCLKTWKSLCIRKAYAVLQVSTSMYMCVIYNMTAASVLQSRCFQYVSFIICGC